jgi:hypothetical protein
MDPDPGGPKVCGSGSPTLDYRLLVYRMFLKKEEANTEKKSWVYKKKVANNFLRA